MPKIFTAGLMTLILLIPLRVASAHAPKNATLLVTVSEDNRRIEELRTLPEGNADSAPTLNALLAGAQGRDIRLPAGIFSIRSSPLIASQSNFVLEGAGPQRTILRFAANANTRIPSLSGASALLAIHSSDNVTIRNLTVDCNRLDNPGDSDGIILLNPGNIVEGLSNLLVDNVEIKGCGGNGIHALDAGNHLTLSNNRIIDTGRNGSNASHAIFIYRGDPGVTSAIYVYHNEIDTTSPAASGAEAIKVVATNPGATIHDIWQTDNRIMVGKSPDSSGTGIEDFAVYPATESGLHVSGNSVICNAGDLAYTLNKPSEWGISLGGNSSIDDDYSNVISGNDVKYCGGYGIEDTMPNTLILGNTLNWSGYVDADLQQGVPHHPTIGNVAIIGNTIRNTLQHHDAIMAINANTGGNGVISAGISITSNHIIQPGGNAISIIGNGKGPNLLRDWTIGQNVIEGSRWSFDGAISAYSASLESVTMKCSANDNGRWVKVAGAGGAALTTRIVSCVSPSQALLAQTASNGVHDAAVTIGPVDGTDAVIAANAAAVEGTIALNKIDWWWTGTPCSTWGVQVVNGALASMFMNRYESVTCRWQNQRSENSDYSILEQGNPDGTGSDGNSIYTNVPIKNRCSGLAKLTNGSVTVAGQSCLSTDRPLLCVENNTTRTPSAVSCSISGTTLTIQSALATDSSTVSWSN